MVAGQALLLLSLCAVLQQLSCEPHSTEPHSTSPNATFESYQEAVEYCSGFDDLYRTIHDDLEPWKETGISRELMRLARMKYTTAGQNKGMMLAFKDGRWERTRYTHRCTQPVMHAHTARTCTHAHSPEWSADCAQQAVRGGGDDGSWAAAPRQHPVHLHASAAGAGAAIRATHARC